MIEQRINILGDAVLKIADCICFTSNGIVKNNGELVMGCGVALAFKNYFPGIQRAAGIQVSKTGNHVYLLAKRDGVNIVSFPTKHHYKNPSDLKLIERSASELMALTTSNGWSKVFLPRPGCNMGRLHWPTVKQTIEKILDDRIIICSL